MSTPDSIPTINPGLGNFIRLNEEIAAVVRARLPLEPHLEGISAELPARTRQIVERISHRLSAGEHLIAAIEAECSDLPSIYRATMLAGTLSGHPGKAIEMLVDTASRMHQIRRVTGFAILYPLIVITITAALFAIVVTSIIPSFAWLNRTHFGPIATLSRWPAIAVILAAAVPTLAIAMAAAWWWRSRTISDKWSSRLSMLAWLPGVRAVSKWASAAEFSELLLLMIQNGVPLDRALQLVGEASANKQVRSATMQIAENARCGNSLLSKSSNAIDSDLAAFPLLLRLALSHSADRPLFTTILRQASTLYRDRALCAAEWYSDYMPIVLTVAVAGSLTLAFALLVLWPYASALREIAGSTWR